MTLEPSSRSTAHQIADQVSRLHQGPEYRLRDREEGGEPSTADGFVVSNDVVEDR
jgi:hypothetical protein